MYFTPNATLFVYVDLLTLCTYTSVLMKIATAHFSQTYNYAVTWLDMLVVYCPAWGLVRFWRKIIFV